jgi:hypothetical protein
MITHFKQKTNVSCGAACYRMMIGNITEKQACDEVKTTKKGTYTSNVYHALLKRFPKEKVGIATLNADFGEQLHWLDLMSKNRILYFGCDFVNRAYGGKGGRDKHRYHAILLSDGMVYDPSEDQPYPIEAYFHTFNKRLIIDGVILLDLN